MKLYVYDHCPFCVRARMPLGLKNIDAEVVYLDNHDEETPIGMIGAKMLPILNDRDGHMGESLDIVHKLDVIDGQPIFDGSPTEALLTWLKTHDATVNTLVIPRAPNAIYPEFVDPEAIAYFTAKKEATFGPFAELIAQTDVARAKMEAALDELIALLPNAERPSIDDIYLFPVLRGLTIVPDLTFPQPVMEYMTMMADRCKTPLVQLQRVI
ncbi:glutaredoxin, GrxB family [Marivivens niveibacter]|uniref:Glutaredoxin, GrxB family n=1 Tax=Marivivens niveibacter TaxID=1930667 RepID=A0A251WVP1_9RHOB|nr:glutaredoxin 2 [Marivivens niveibacter]OUD08549.1 glutaredoxin, GrxB family [Marivivens niveibacter]